MSAPDFSRVRQIFDDACQRPPAAREGYVRQVAGADQALAGEVLRLLQSDAEAGDFLSRPASSELDTIGHPGALGERIGNYRVIRQLGTGGMGTVFLAIRADDAFRKTVAIKVMRADRTSDEEVRRFRQERQVLAALDHPHIARILDGGSTKDGRPYFVMDYVEGMPIDAYADSKRLNISQRIALFQQVCEAVQYLHDNGIVHRDLKPSNILVTHEGNAKLLDFGIVKVRRPDGMGQTVEMTGGPLMMMTPAYASPEQMRGEMVSKQSDIYSLGVILYELLTGRRPFADDGSGMSRMGAVIYGKEPPKPSTNLSDDARRSPETTSQLRRRLIGDLDAIVLMALRDQQGGRYASVEDFRQDLQRFLDGEMVIAQKDSITTRTAKFVRRNPLAVAATFIFVLAAGFGGWQAVEARIQRERANTREAELQRVVTMLSTRLPEWTDSSKSEEQKVEDVRKLRDAIGKDLKESIDEQPGATPMRADLMNKAVAYLNLAEKLSAGSPKVQKELATAYQTVADVQGHPSERNTLGDRRSAVESYKRAAKLVESVNQSQPNPETEQQLAILTSRLVQLGEPQSRPASPAAKVDLPPVEAPSGSQVTTHKAEKQVTREPEAQHAAPTQAEVAPPPPPPAREPEPAISPEMHQRFALIGGQVENAEAIAGSIRRKLEADGLSLNSTTARELVLMKVSLDSARSAIERGDAAAAKENLDRADAVSRRVLKYFGQ